MQDPWVGALIVMAIAAVFAYGILAVWALLRVKPKKLPPTRSVTYECGEEPDGPAWIRFHPRFYIVALIFVLFDVETIFLMPWALNIANKGLVALIDMFVFLGILFLGWIYAIKKGAIKWQ